jgi:D-methionine transport system ATP-binding protein
MNAPLPASELGATRRLAPAAPQVRLEGVSKVFAGGRGTPVTALDGIDLAMARGSVLGVIGRSGARALGRSGAGKSTLIRLVNGLERRAPVGLSWTTPRSPPCPSAPCAGRGAPSA